MMIYAQMLEQHFTKEAHPQHTKMIIKLRQQVDRLHILIQDMLDTTRLAEGKLILDLSHFDLNKLIQDKVEDMQQNSKNHKIVMQLQSTGKIAGDEERLGQVVNNLLSNAIKYSPLGGKILLSTKTIGDFVKVSVTDYGIGIPKESLDRIFQRFYRVLSNEARTFPGMGIGLSICKDIIDMHKGKIEVESVVGLGSTFNFIIPIQPTKEINENNIIS
jgi:signal transduction histidine kinase